MPLTPGTRLGVYEITAQIGVGGMGAVYRATDTALGRQVAIKSCPMCSRRTPNASPASSAKRKRSRH